MDKVAKSNFAFPLAVSGKEPGQEQVCLFNTDKAVV